MKLSTSGLALLVFGTIALVPGISEANRGSAGHGGGFRGGVAHVAPSHGSGGHVGGFRRGVPIAGVPGRRFHGGPVVRSFPGRSGVRAFIGGGAIAAPLYSYGPYYAYSAPYYSYAPGYAAPAAAPGYWYYCPAYQAYYPYVEDCPGGWQPVAPQSLPY
jgi:hypothetical protein